MPDKVHTICIKWKVERSFILDLKFPISVQGQNRYNIRISIHQRGEQTLKKLARTHEQIKGFASNTNAIANRSCQVENFNCLNKMCNLTTKLNMYMQIRPSYILRSRHMVFKVINTFKNHYINLFDLILGKNTLYNVSSDAAMPARVTDYLLLLHEKGKDLCKGFLQSRILITTKRFDITPREITTQCFWLKKLVPPARINKEPNNIDMNWNVLGQLILFSMKPDYKIDFEEAFKYPLQKFCQVCVMLMKQRGAAQSQIY